MFALGGSLCAPDVRHGAVPDSGPEQWPREIDRVLVLGGCTDWSVETLAARDCEITVVESAEHIEQAKRWADTASLHCFDQESGLGDFAANWYDLVLLLGGTAHTGGPFLGHRRWAEFGSSWLSGLRELVSGRGVVVADSVAYVDSAVRGVALGTAMDGSLAYVEGVVMRGGSEHRLVLRTSHCDPGGVVTAESLACVEWVDRFPALEADDEPTWATRGAAVADA